jgi:1-deoxy-D-xylulose-5-phosphate reductoisomerase
MKRIAILGSTGSIGRQALQVIGSFTDCFSATGLAGGRNIALLAQQIIRFRPEVAWIRDAASAEGLVALLKRAGRASCGVLHGDESLGEFLEKSAPDVVVSAVSGQAGLYPTFLAVTAGYDIALANKESLVMMGPLLMRLALQNGANIMPIDSEHSALRQCLIGEAPESVKRLVLTASGGPFRNDSLERLQRRTFQETQEHPVWKMGEKINVDSATLMNKGLEVIEACILFDQSPDKIDVLIHPECIVHSMVEFVDGSWKAQLGVPSMEVPILYALSAPDRLKYDACALSPEALQTLRFERVDRRRFRCLEIAYQAARDGGSLPAVMCVADEVAIEYFRNATISFMQMPEVIEATMQRHETVEIDGLETLLAVKEWAAQSAEVEARRIMNRN